MTRTVNRNNAQRSGWKMAGGRDAGQRYVVRYRDGMGTTRAYGFTESRDIAEQWVEAINANVMWDSPRIVDRQTERKNNGTR